MTAESDHLVILVLQFGIAEGYRIWLEIQDKKLNETLAEIAEQKNKNNS